MELYKYLYKLYNSDEEHKERYTLDNFMYNWLDGNMANECMYETFVCGEFVGCHYRSFEIDHNKKTIEFFIEDGESND